MLAKYIRKRKYNRSIKLLSEYLKYHGFQSEDKYKKTFFKYIKDDKVVVIQSKTFELDIPHELILKFIDYIVYLVDDYYECDIFLDGDNALCSIKYNIDQYRDVQYYLTMSGEIEKIWVNKFYLNYLHTLSAKYDITSLTINPDEDEDDGFYFEVESGGSKMISDISNMFDDFEGINWCAIKKRLINNNYYKFDSYCDDLNGLIRVLQDL